MTQTKRHCSTPDQLLTFLRGQLSAREEAELQQHLNDCISCRERLENTAADASVWNEAREFFGNGALHTSTRDSSDEHEEANQGTYRIRQVLDSLRPTDDPESLGRIGGYEVTGVVGAGGMGVVLKAHDRSLDRIVAIKVMSPHLASSGSARKRFAREAKAAAAVLHPNVIAIHSVASEDANPFLVMPYVRGASLQKRIDSQGPLPLKDTLRIGAQIAAGLAAAHEQGLVHRDIKPANILLEEGVERVTITDFGLARAVDDASMTCSGVIAGTPQYMSPEQTRGEPIDARSDLFSLGSVLYAMCAGRSPFRAETTYGMLHRIANDSPTPVCEVNSDIPVWLGHIIERLMAKRPEDRFESAAQVAVLLEGCLAHVQQPAAMPLPEAVAALAPKRTRRPPIGKLSATAAGAFALFFAGILIVLELDKGTLTIESEIDDVPIRILQGDKVVDRLTVTKSGNSVRVAAGTYVVELETKLDGMVVENDHVSLMRDATEEVKIRYSKTAIDANDGLSTLRFETPDALMKHAADCQSKGDGPGFMACWTDQPFKDLVPSYLLTSLMQLQYFENAPSGNKPQHPEELLELKQILAEEFGGNEAGKSLLALAMAHKEIADRSDDKFAEAAEATAKSPLVQLLASGSTNLINSRSFVMKIAALHEKYKEADVKKEPRILAYTVEQDGDTAVATEATGKNKFGLIKTEAGWRINDLWYGLKAKEESASLQGEWEFISVESDGVIREYTTLEMQRRMARLTITGDMWTVKAGNGTNDIGSGGHHVEIDGNKLTFHGMTTMPGLGSNDEIPTIGYGLYEVDGDTLTYLMTPAVAESALNVQSEPPIQFPESFDTKGTGNNVFRLQRVPSKQKDQKTLSAFEARTLDDVTSVYNEQTRQLLTELFNPPIPDLTTDQMRAAMLDAAEQYRKQGKVEIASALKTSAETNRLANRLRFMGMSGTMSEGFRQITPAFHFEVASNSLYSVILPKAELRYSLHGWSSKTWGDIHPPITGEWELIAVEERGETLTQDAFNDWRKKHASWTDLSIDEKSLTMAGDKFAMRFDFSVDHDAGVLPQYTISQEGDTKYVGVLMGDGFVDDTKLVVAVDIEGRSKPETFHTKDGKTTNLTYRRFP